MESIYFRINGTLDPIFRSIYTSTLELDPLMIQSLVNLITWARWKE